MRRNRSLFYSWFFSYLVILLIPLLASGVMYTKAGELVEREIGKANAALVTQLQMEVDGRMSNIQQLFQQLSVNTRVQAAASVKGNFQPKNMYNIYELVRDLNRYALIDSFYEDMFIYFNSTGTVVNKQGHNAAQLFYDVFIASPDLPFEAFERLSAAAALGTMMPYTGRNGEHYIAFVHPLAYLEVPAGAATIFITVRAERLVQTLDAMKWNPENTVLIISEENSVISASSDASILDAVDYARLGEASQQIDGVPYTLSVQASSVMPWKYVVATPTRVFYEGARRLQVYTLAVLLFCVGVCTALAYYFTRRNFNPIKALVAALTKEGPQAGMEKNQFQWILRAVDDLIQEKESASYRLYRNTLLLKKNVINKLLKDLHDHRTIDEEIAESGLRLTSGHYAVVLFKTQAQAEQLREAESSGQLNLSGFVAVNCFENLLPPEYTVESAELDAYAVSIVSLPSADEGHLLALENTAYEAQAKAGEQQIEAHIAIGGLCEGTFGLQDSFREAMEAMEYHALVGGDDVILYGSIRNQQKKYFYPIEVEQRILNAVKAGDSKTASEDIANVLGRNFADAGVSPEMRRLLLADMSSTIVKALDDESEAGLLTEMEQLKGLFVKATPVGFQAALLDIVERVCAHNRRRWEVDSRSETLAREVSAYVQAQYADPNLSISMIGAAFGLTPSYISKQFKEQTGEGLLAFISNVRVEKAKDLLQTGASLNDACAQVGYTNVGTLIRVFKKTYGITPGQVKKVT